MISLKVVLKDSDSYLFVDDFALCLKGRSLPSVFRRLQLGVNNVNKVVQERGFRFSASLVEFVLFTNQRGVLWNQTYQTGWDFYQSGR